jgi:predicted ATPase/DNA-binding CsgD family transcriptional regulator/Flp pilus assembly protein TadD
MARTENGEVPGLPRIPQVTHAVPNGTPPGRPEEASRSCRTFPLPLPVDSFVGRDGELSELARLLRRSRLVTLVGPGGAGKTRLALEFLAQNSTTLDQCTFFVELQSLTGGDLLPQRVAAALDVAERPGDDLVETLATALRSRPALLVLDNCEHVVEASARLADALLRRCPLLHILGTSREALRVPGEVTFPVGELAVPEPGETVSRPSLLRSGAVRLFLDRARDCVPGFELTPDNGPAIAAICARLDGMPLAIELAARRVRLLPVEEILARLDHRFDLLTVAPRTVAERHQNLRAAIAWSYDLLDPVEQAVFRRLSVFAGNVDLDSATAVCAGDEVAPEAVLDAVSALVAKSLLVPLRGRRKQARFRQIESIRMFAAEQLDEAGETATAFRRLTDRLTALAEPAMYRVFPPATLVARLDEESDNLLPAVRWAANQGDDRCGLLAAVLVMCWRHRGFASEGRHLLDWVLERLDPDSGYRVLVLEQAAILARWRADNVLSAALASEGMEVERQHRRPPVLAKVLHSLGQVRLATGDVAGAEDCFREAVDVVLPTDQPLDLAGCEHNLAWATLWAGDLDRAEALLDKSLPVIRAEAEPPMQAAALHTRGVLALMREELDSAEEVFREALGIAPASPESLEGLAIVAVRRGDPERALRLLGGVGALRDATQCIAQVCWRRRVDEALATARRQRRTAVAEAALTAGARLRTEQLAAYAREGVWTGPQDDSADRLSDREREVACLVAKGLTNRQIANRLSISTRTVDTHLENIRTKLDLRSRAQIAIWAADADSG